MWIIERGESRDKKCGWSIYVLYMAGILQWLDARMLRRSPDTLAAKMKAAVSWAIIRITESNSHSEPRCCYKSQQSAETLGGKMKG